MPRRLTHGLVSQHEPRSVGIATGVTKADRDENDIARMYDHGIGIDRTMCIRVAHCLKVEVVRWARRADGGGGAAVVNKRPRLEEGRPVSVATDADPVGHDVVIVVVRWLLFPRLLLSPSAVPQS